MCSNGSKKLIINADDFGYSRGVNYGIIDSYRLGVLTSTSIMAGMPGFDHAVTLAKENPELGVGVHLTLTFGSTCTNGLEVIAKNNHFNYVDPRETNKLIIDPAEIEQELTAQLEKVYAAGIQPTHLDSHHHVHKEKGVQEIVQHLARKYKLPLRWGYATQNKISDISHVDKLIMDFDEVVEQVKVPLNKESSDLKCYIKQLIQEILESSGQVVELMTHPGYVDQFLSMNSSMNQVRAKEVAVLTAPFFADELEKAGIERISYAEL